MRRADPKRLLIFFQGGRGCFSRKTCERGTIWFDDRVDYDDDPSLGAGGILDLSNPQNPFRDWSIVFIPSCTGDVHTGTRLVRYGPVRVEQKGFFNARAALGWAFDELPAPELVFLTGCSAGSVGSAFHADAVLRRYPDARVSQLGDSLAFLLPPPESLARWGAQEQFSDWFGTGERRWIMEEFLSALAREYPERTFARFNYVRDRVQEAFYDELGGDEVEFAARLRAVETCLKHLALDELSIAEEASALCERARPKATKRL